MRIFISAHKNNKIIISCVSLDDIDLRIFITEPNIDLIYPIEIYK
jgi:hypothetical protein